MGRTAGTFSWFPPGIPPGLGVSAELRPAQDGTCRCWDQGEPGRLRVRGWRSGTTIKRRSSRCWGHPLLGDARGSRIERPVKLLCRLNPRWWGVPQRARGTSTQRTQPSSWLARVGGGPGLNPPLCPDPGSGLHRFRDQEQQGLCTSLVLSRGRFGPPPPAPAL